MMVNDDSQWLHGNFTYRFHWLRIPSVLISATHTSRFASSWICVVRKPGKKKHTMYKYSQKKRDSSGLPHAGQILLLCASFLVLDPWFFSVNFSPKKAQLRSKSPLGTSKSNSLSWCSQHKKTPSITCRQYTLTMLASRLVAEHKGDKLHISMDSASASNIWPMVLPIFPMCSNCLPIFSHRFPIVSPDLPMVFPHFSQAFCLLYRACRDGNLQWEISTAMVGCKLPWPK